MNPPSLRTLILGYPLVTILMVAGAAYFGWQCHILTTPGTLLEAVVAIWAAWHSVKAFDHRRRHRAWRRDCMAVAGTAPGSRRIKRPLLGIAIFIVGCIAIVGFADKPELTLILVLIPPAFATAVILAWKIGKAIWRFVRRERAPRAARPVRVAVGARLLPLPSFQQASRALPAYCRQLLERP